MAKAADDLLLVQRTGGRFEASDDEHLFVVLEGIVAGQGDAGRWAAVGQVVQFEFLIRTKRRMCVMREKCGQSRAKI